jgi:hypothetical protein
MDHTTTDGGDLTWGAIFETDRVQIDDLYAENVQRQCITALANDLNLCAPLYTAS